MVSLMLACEAGVWKEGEGSFGHVRRVEEALISLFPFPLEHLPNRQLLSWPNILDQAMWFHNNDRFQYFVITVVLK